MLDLREGVAAGEAVYLQVGAPVGGTGAAPCLALWVEGRRRGLCCIFGCGLYAGGLSIDCQ